MQQHPGQPQQHHQQFKPPAQPKTVLRGHQAQVHATSFLRGNRRLATGDADGHVVLWDLTIMRARAVWRAHTNAILAIAEWGGDRIITHGRDHQLIVWKLSEEDEARLSTALPLDPTPRPRPQPWIQYILPVNTMNFCGFASCPVVATDPLSSSRDDEDREREWTERSNDNKDEILIAVPNTTQSEAIDIYHLPTQTRLHTAVYHNMRGKKGVIEDKDGMVMALALFYHPVTTLLNLVAAYESGSVVVSQRSERGNWIVLYMTQSHSQPILSLDVAPGKEYFFTSSADSLLIKHPIPRVTASELDTFHPNTLKTTAPFDSVTVPATRCGGSLLSAALAAESSSSQPQGQALPAQILTGPLKVLNTKHSGQQGLRIRSDGKIFATAGWDSKARIYSTRTMKELAVLKWQSVGCYAVAFSGVGSPSSPKNDSQTELRSQSGEQGKQSWIDVPESSHVAVEERGRASKIAVEANVKVEPRLLDTTVRQNRVKQAREAHWLAAGAKDGKISLWDVY